MRCGLHVTPQNKSRTMQLLDAGRNCNTLIARNLLLDYPNCLICAKHYNLNYIELSVCVAVISKI